MYGVRSCCGSVDKTTDSQSWGTRFDSAGSGSIALGQDILSSLPKSLGEELKQGRRQGVCLGGGGANASASPTILRQPWKSRFEKQSFTNFVQSARAIYDGYIAVHKFFLCFVRTDQWAPGQQCMEVRKNHNPWLKYHENEDKIDNDDVFRNDHRIKFLKLFYQFQWSWYHSFQKTMFYLMK